MDTPQPVDLNKLKSILGASKTIMNKVESGNFETGHVDARALTEDGVRELQAEGVRRPASQSTSQIGYDTETVQNSRLPEAIKKIMVERPIPQLTSPNYTFSLDDVADLMEDKPMSLPKKPKTNSTQKLVNESLNNSNYITINKEELKEMVSSIVNEKLLEFMTKTNNKAITEDAVKKTINMLVKEGKLTPKKKTL